MKLPKNPVKIGAVLAQLLGAILTIAGAYSLTGGSELTPTGIMSPQEAGQIFLAVGGIMLFASVVLFYFGFKPSRLSLSSILLGLCSFAIPVVLFAIGYSLIAGIIIIICGFLFLGTILIWLSS